jgi:hypothetical protein
MNAVGVPVVQVARSVVAAQIAPAPGLRQSFRYTGRIRRGVDIRVDNGGYIHQHSSFLHSVRLNFKHKKMLAAKVRGTLMTSICARRILAVCSIV